MTTDRAELLRAAAALARTVALAEADAENQRLSAENARLREALDEAQLRSIEARNPGIDMDEVRRTRAAASLSETGGEADKHEAPPENVVPLIRGLPVTPEYGHPSWADGRPILIGDDVLVDEVDALDDDGNEYVMQRAAGWVHSVSPEEVGVLGLWRESDEVYEALPNELTRRETGGEA